ncbi:hypothetical protein C8J56DRAFT_895271 [Mycena floridula]|nr:hypothetical protein C8J56DRAFT_895271 [Mycena floridula]
MLFLRRSQHTQSVSPDEEHDDNTIDPELGLRTVQTAASAVAESVRKNTDKKRAEPVDPQSRLPTVAPGICLKADEDGEPVVRYERNKVRMTKYTILTFIPKNLFEQFKRVANLFFLLLVVLQLFSVFGAASGPIAVVPIAFILTVTAIKDAVEDYPRATLDEEVNTSAATKLGQWRNVNQPTDPKNWEGDERCQEAARSRGWGSRDRIMLSKAGDNDNASISTRDPKNSSVAQLSSTDFGVKYNQSVPSQSSVGVVDWQKRSGTARWERTLWKKLEVGDIVLLQDNDQVPANVVVLSTSDPDNLCYLETKNLDGETNLKPRRSVKAMSNMTSEEDIERSSFFLDSEPPHQNLYLHHGVLKYKDPLTGEKKQEPCSRIEKETNFNVIVNFVILSLMCVIAAVFNGLQDSDKNTSAGSFEAGSDPTSSYILNALVTLISSLIIFQNIVPIALYISIEIVKTVQAYFIFQDIDMYYEPYNTPCVPKTWNISDDLGQIEYVFSDKTGTLTQNIMGFQKCSINGDCYGEGVTEAQRGAATRNAESLDPAELNAKLVALKNQMLGTMERAFKNRYLQPEKLNFVSLQLAQDLADRNSEQRPHPDQSFPYHIDYKAESPDKAALVAVARGVGFPFVGKRRETVDIEVMRQLGRYTSPQVLEFNSTGKRMSTIMRRPDGRLILYTKGADSVIYERLAKNTDPGIKAKTSRGMEMFVNNGLRTLCIAYRWLQEDEYLNRSRTFDTVASAIENRDEEMDKANELIEHLLHILGATALEDRLQEGVPEAIETLHRARIKLWVLTGNVFIPILFATVLNIVLHRQKTPNCH